MFRRQIATSVCCLISFCLGSLFSWLVFSLQQQQQPNFIQPEGINGLGFDLPDARGLEAEWLAGRQQQQSPLPPPSRTDALWSRVRVFCLILTSPSNHRTKAIHLRDTWVPRCNGYAFMSTQADDLLPAIALQVSEGRDNLWSKTVAAFRHVRRHHLADYDFFLKVDDDTYVVMENLRSFLAEADPSALLYAGRRFRPFLKQGYMSGGAGYVLSREAVHRFVDGALVSGDEECPGRFARFQSEDINMGSCMQFLGAKILDSLDSQGRERFHPFSPVFHLLPGALSRSNWLWRYNYYPMKQGPDCCSDASISFHYVAPQEMHLLEYLIYRLKPHGASASPGDNATASTVAPSVSADSVLTGR